MVWSLEITSSFSDSLILISEEVDSEASSEGALAVDCAWLTDLVLSALSDNLR